MPDKVAEINWQAQPLGEMSDRRLSVMLGVPESMVRYHRIQAGVHAYGGRAVRAVNWAGVRLGQQPDRVIAEELGVCVSVVAGRRRNLSIPAFRETSKVRLTIDWDKQPLGQMSDHELGRPLGVSGNIVASERIKRGIPTFRSTFEISWGHTPIGSASDEDVAKMLGIPLKKVQSARQQRGVANPNPPRRIEWDAQPLGKVSDGAIARAVGVSTASVRSARVARNIPRRDLICLTTKGERVNYPEAVIDLYWHEKGIPHQSQATIGKYRVDWLFPEKTVVEYAGFAEHRRLGETYKKKLAAKVATLRALGYTVNVIWPGDLAKYDTGTTPRFTESHSCIVCGKATLTTTRARCGPHYKEWLAQEHRGLPVVERLNKIRLPLRRVYEALQKVGGEGLVDFTHRPTLVIGPAGTESTGAKRRTLEVLSQYDLISITHHRKTTSFHLRDICL